MAQCTCMLQGLYENMREFKEIYIYTYIHIYIYIYVLCIYRYLCVHALASSPAVSSHLVQDLNILI